MGIDIFGQAANGFLEMRGKLKQITSLVLTEDSMAGDAYDGGKMLGRAYADEKEDWSIRKEVSELCWCFLINNGVGLLLSRPDPHCGDYRRVRVVHMKTVDVFDVLGD